MKHLLPFIALTAVLFSCKQKTNTTESGSISEIEIVEENPYPEELQKIFEAHGGLEAWKAMETLSFVLPKPENPETHTIDLRTRNEKIASNAHTIGFDGKPWVLDVDGNYEGNPEFYHNLMFYFYAMPFVLADDGINYEEIPPLDFEGKSYPGIKISYNDGVGTSPKDEYYLHYNPDSHQMEWLGYTVTYRTGEKSDKVNWIRYNDWETSNGLLMPNSISWYTVEDGKIKEVRNQVPFEDVVISEESKPVSFYDKPTEASYWEKPESD